MKTLVTWTDRGPRSSIQSKRPRATGPVKSTLMVSRGRYQRVVLLATPEVEFGARQLAKECTDLGVRVELVLLETNDTYERLFTHVQQQLAQIGLCDVLISAGSPKARAVWLALEAMGRIEGRLLQIQGSTMRTIRLGSDKTAASPPVVKPTEHRSLRETVEATELRIIQATLMNTAGNLLRTAKILGIDRNTLKRKMRQMGLQKSDYEM